MQRLKKILLIGIIFLLSGCTDFFMICSLYPFYLDKNVKMMPEIEGNWQALPIHLKIKNKVDKDNEDHLGWSKADTTATWQIKRFVSADKAKTKSNQDTIIYRPMDYYLVKLITGESDSTSYRFKMVLFEVNKAIYADFMPLDNSAMQNSRFARESYFIVHTLAKLELLGNQLHISWLGANYTKDMIEKKRVRISYNWVSSAKRLLLTGSSEELTGMIERYASDPRFINWDEQPAQLKLNRQN